MAKNKNESAVFDTETLLMAIEIMKTMPDNAASSAAAAAASAAAAQAAADSVRVATLAETKNYLDS